MTEERHAHCDDARRIVNGRFSVAAKGPENLSPKKVQLIWAVNKIHMQMSQEDKKYALKE